MVSIPSTSALVGFAVSVLVIGIGVAYAPEIKSFIQRGRRAVSS